MPIRTARVVLCIPMPTLVVPSVADRLARYIGDNNSEHSDPHKHLVTNTLDTGNPGIDQWADHSGKQYVCGARQFEGTEIRERIESDHPPHITDAGYSDPAIASAVFVSSNSHQRYGLRPSRRSI